MRFSLTSLLGLFFLSATAAACTVTTKEIGPPPPSSEPSAANPEDGTPTTTDEQETPKKPATPVTPPATAKDFDKITVSGRFAKVDVTYGRAGQFIVLDMKGDASALQSSDKTVALSKINVAKLTSYELLFPQQGGCDGPPEVTIEQGAIHLSLQRGGKPSGTISDCHFLAEYIRASDGGFQATLKDVPLQGGGKIKELVIDLLGPAS